MRADDGRVEGLGTKEMKSSTHWMVGNTEWYFSKAIVASTTLPWIPPAVVKPSMHMLYIYTIFLEDTDVFLVCRKMGELQ